MKSEHPSLCAPPEALMKEFVKAPAKKSIMKKKKKSGRFNPFEKK